MEATLWTLFRLITRPLFFFERTQQPVDGSMGDWDHMMGYGGYGELLMWLVLIIGTGALIYSIFNRSKSTETLSDSAKVSPVDILKR